MSLILKSFRAPSVLNIPKNHASLFRNYGSTAILRSPAEAAQKVKYNAVNQKSELTSCLFEARGMLHRRGRISDLELTKIMGAIQSGDVPTSAQLLLVLRCGGLLALTATPEVRINYIDKLWSHLLNSDIKLDISHCNAYLQSNLENERLFSPEEFLRKLEKMNVAPNRVTYQLLLSMCCHQGDLSGATEILEKMKAEKVPLNETVFCSLISGHFFAGDVVGAEGIIDLMKEKDLEISSQAYFALLCGYAMNGNMEKIRATLEKCKSEDIAIDNRQLLEVTYYLCLHGHVDHAKEILNLTERNNKYNALAMATAYRLLHKRLYDSALVVHNTMLDIEDNHVRYMLRYVAWHENMDGINRLCECISKTGNEIELLPNILLYALQKNRTEVALEILDELHSTGQRIKKIYFLPLLVNAAKENDLPGIISYLSLMHEKYQVFITEADISLFIFKNLKNYSTARLCFSKLLRNSFPRGLTVKAYLQYLMDSKLLDKVAELSAREWLIPFISALNERLAYCLKNTEDVNSFVLLLHNLYTQKKIGDDSAAGGADKEESNVALDPKEYISELVIMANSILNKDNIVLAILQELVSKNLALTSNAIESIEEKWRENQEILEILSQLREKLSEDAFTDSNLSPLLKDYCQTVGSQSEVKARFNELCQNNELEEAERLITEMSELQIPRNYVILIKKLKNNDANNDKCLEYLKKLTCCLEDKKDSKNSYVYFATDEWIKRGNYKEALALLKSLEIVPDNVNAIYFLQITKILSRGSEDEKREIVKMSQEEEWSNAFASFASLCIRNKDYVKLLEFLEAIKGTDLKWAIKWNGSLVLNLHKNKDEELFKRAVSVLEELFEPKTVFSELLLAYSCTGDIKSGSRLLDRIKGTVLPTVPGFSNIMKSDQCVEILENCVKIIKNDPRCNNINVYENLLRQYIRRNEKQKGLDLWTDLQEQNIIPSEKFMVMLSELSPESSPTSVAGDWLHGLPTDTARQIKASMTDENYNRMINVITKASNAGQLNADHLEEILSYVKAYKLDQERPRAFYTVVALLEKERINKFHESGRLQDYLLEWEERFQKKDSLSKNFTKVFPFRYYCEIVSSGAHGKPDMNDSVAKILTWVHVSNSPGLAQMGRVLSTVVHAIVSKEKRLDRFISEATLSENEMALKTFLSHEKFTKDAQVMREIQKSFVDKNIFPEGNQFAMLKVEDSDDVRHEAESKGDSTPASSERSGGSKNSEKAPSI